MRSYQSFTDYFLVKFMPSKLMLILILIVVILPILVGFILEKMGKDNPLEKPSKNTRDSRKIRLYLPIVLGALIILLCGFTHMNTSSFVEKAEKTTAVITDKEYKSSHVKSKIKNVKYHYTVAYTDNGVEKKATLSTNSGSDFGLYDEIEVYYIPDNKEEIYSHSVVAVDFEKSQANELFVFGFIYIVVGILQVMFLDPDKG